MGTAEKPMKVNGRVVEALPDALFRVEIEPEKLVLAYLAGKMRLHRIRVLVGDKVEVELDRYGGKGRIVKRL
ncbi:MAG: translation initiation factor IF-1 [Parcubacteria group bacterium Gr01-1014_17]|nr:MAG: translation initiation factor IF-1 [Parcubacteria group bacterium Gr01-1014_17]